MIARISLLCSPLSRAQWGGIGMLCSLLVFVLFEKLLIQGSTSEQHLDLVFSAPVDGMPLGADHLGRSNSARLADAILNSLMMAVLCVSTAVVTGLFTGVWAGWKGGWVDRGFSVLVNIVMALPGLVIVLLFGAIFPGSFVLLFIAISITMWADFFRVIRSRTMLAVRSDAFESSCLFGFGPWYLFRRHIWPVMKTDVYTLSCFGAGNAVLALAALGFLYVGLKPPKAELGMMMVELFRYYHQAFWVLIQPIIVVSVIILSCHLLSQGKHAEEFV
ncbi:Glutathione transport system permease protein GsiD [Vibrio aerogenes CECT 7868]|uniref:Glutathione transport system permease protein GsiD n=1 Tax=Vibrio aerogenes CECT 7868 TaxID=1216006 RepID=A0A1M6DC71_9VIBR|nr:ABC transporter permease [Vibrio aerogenes]SHI70864.1 Glutathione transport system permease protein GsiD [Vibrio aerogenes CECT 7868]